MDLYLYFFICLYPILTKFYLQNKYFKSGIVTSSVLIVTFAILTGQLTINQGTGQEVAQSSVLKTTATNASINIPLTKGYEDGNEIFFIATDTSDELVAQQETEFLGFSVNFSPLLSQIPEASLSQAYVFTNGISGEGPFGFQIPVLSAKPGDSNYSPLLHVNTATWRDNSSAKILKSVQDILDAEKNSDLTINKTGIVVNHPVINDMMPNSNITNESSSLNTTIPEGLPPQSINGSNIPKI